MTRTFVQTENETALVFISKVCCRKQKTERHFHSIGKRNVGFFYQAERLTDLPKQKYVKETWRELRTDPTWEEASIVTIGTMRAYQIDIFHLSSCFGLRRTVAKLRSGVAREERKNFSRPLPFSTWPRGLLPPCVGGVPSLDLSLRAFDPFRSMTLRGTCPVIDMKVFPFSDSTFQLGRSLFVFPHQCTIPNGRGPRTRYIFLYGIVVRIGLTVTKGVVSRDERSRLFAVMASNGRFFPPFASSRKNPKAHRSGFSGYRHTKNVTVERIGA